MAIGIAFCLVGVVVMVVSVLLLNTECTEPGGSTRERGYKDKEGLPGKGKNGKTTALAVGGVWELLMSSCIAVVDVKFVVCLVLILIGFVVFFPFFFDLGEMEEQDASYSESYSDEVTEKADSSSSSS